MRVLLAFEPPDGGVAEHIAQLAVGLRDHGWEPEVAGPEGSLADARLIAAGIRVHHLGFTRGYGRPWRDARVGAALLALLRGGRFDLLHCHSAKAGAIGRVMGAAARTPVVYTPHCLPFIGPVGTGRRVAFTAIERVLAGLTRRIVCVCEDERREALAARLPRARLRVVHNGCPACEPTGEVDVPTAELAEGGPLVAAVTVLREQKRVDVLLDAVPAILARVGDARVAVIGDGPLRDDLQERATRLGLDTEPRFAFLAFAGPAARHLRSTSVYVLPSAYESFPIGLLEAMACGVPSVATDVGGAREAVSAKTGVLVEPGNVTELVNAVCSLLEDDKRREAMGAASREVHAARFTLERMVKATAAVYDDALG